MAFTVRVNGFDVRCDTVAEVAELVRAAPTRESARAPETPAPPTTGGRRRVLDSTLTEELRALLPFAAKLYPRHRQLLELRAADKGPAEIAAALDMTPQAVTTMIAEARRRAIRLRDGKAPPPKIGPRGEGSISENGKGWRFTYGGKGDGRVVSPTYREKSTAEAARAAFLAGQPLPAAEPRARGPREKKQPPAPAAEDEATPSPGRGELLADQRGGAPDEPGGAAPSAVKHEGSVCQKVQVAESASSDDEEPEAAFPTMVVPGDTADGDRHLKRRRCKACGETGHNRRSCPTLGKAPAARPNVDPPEAPIGVNAGDVFVVVEDFTEEETGLVWLARDRWKAVGATGRETDGYAEWTLESADGVSLPGHPQLHPFMRVREAPNLGAAAPSIASTEAPACSRSTS